MGGRRGGGGRFGTQRYGAGKKWGIMRQACWRGSLDRDLTRRIAILRSCNEEPWSPGVINLYGVVVSVGHLLLINCGLSERGFEGLSALLLKPSWFRIHKRKIR